MKVGQLGDTVFEVSPSRVMTFPEVEESGDSRIEMHEVALGDPVGEFVGPGARSVSLTVQLAAHLGIDTALEISRLEAARDAGTLLPFSLGGKPIGGSGSYWSIKSLSVLRRSFDGTGKTRVADVSIGLIRMRTSTTPTPLSSTVAKSGVTRER